MVYSNCQYSSAFRLLSFILFRIALWSSAGKELSPWLSTRAFLFYAVLLYLFLIKNFDANSQSKIFRKLWKLNQSAYLKSGFITLLGVERRTFQAKTKNNFGKKSRFLQNITIFWNFQKFCFMQLAYSSSDI